MCGITGIVNLRGDPVQPAELSQLTSLIAHRGPFGEGAGSMQSETSLSVTAGSRSSIRVRVAINRWCPVIAAT